MSAYKKLKKKNADLIQDIYDLVMRKGSLRALEVEAKYQILFMGEKFFTVGSPSREDVALYLTLPEVRENGKVLGTGDLSREEIIDKLEKMFDGPTRIVDKTIYAGKGLYSLLKK